MPGGAGTVRITYRLRSGLYFAYTLAEAVTVLAARRIRSRLGRKAPPDRRASFLRIFLLHAFGRQPPIRITCAERSDGAGAQAHTIMSAMCFAQAHGHTYVHTPFAAIDHAEQPAPDWVDAWEKLFNLGDGEERAETLKGRVYNYSSFHPRLYYAMTGGFRSADESRSRTRKGVGRPERHFHPYFYYADSHPESFQAIIPELRRKYWTGKKRSGNGDLMVALHMRRGDVTARNTMRYTPIESVHRTAEAVKSVLTDAGISYSMRLYSQGPADGFAALRDVGVDLCLDVDAVWTMQQLITADVLVMSKSSFSYVAALISDGIKLYEPFWHPPLRSWLPRNSHGRFDRREFERQLKNFR